MLRTKPHRCRACFQTRPITVCQSCGFAWRIRYATKWPMARIIVLGGGRQGRIIANDLAGDHDVTVADVTAVNIPGIRSMQRDLSRPLELVGALQEYEVVVG